MMNKMKKAIVAAVAITSATLASNVNAEITLNVDVFNPESNSIFPVSSSIISGTNEVLLVDAQFQRNDAEGLVKKILVSGKTLKTVFISHGDPDFYFGLDVIKAAFPEVKILATESTVSKIKKSMDGKLGYWGPILKDNAPKKLFVPEVINTDKLMVDGTPIYIKNLQHDPVHSYLWIPSIKTVLGGVVVFDKMHVWVADTKTKGARDTWLTTLSNIEELKPEVVIPGHFLAGSKKDLSSIAYMKSYLADFEKAVSQSKTSDDVVSIMTKKYPNVGAENILSLGSKVVMGEMEWR